MQKRRSTGTQEIDGIWLREGTRRRFLKTDLPEKLEKGVVETASIISFINGSTTSRRHNEDADALSLTRHFRKTNMKNYIVLHFI
ncbi:hypothetical protein Y1Q_0007298 [Alligator mississippiensis]|uniref:Uncharacterized protein n=1 Tax=Alligator mississippiensis TaxID=8496 RepID=A0A151NN99_ALLMI|nr:hypothetical protein Y1Q_0007298 [Alligator mississippiensis]